VVPVPCNLCLPRVHSPRTFYDSRTYSAGEGRRVTVGSTESLGAHNVPHADILRFWNSGVQLIPTVCRICLQSSRTRWTRRWWDIIAATARFLPRFVSLEVPGRLVANAPLGMESIGFLLSFSTSSFFSPCIRLHVPLLASFSTSSS
jgi:hypothetical protein